MERKVLKDILLMQNKVKEDSTIPRTLRKRIEDYKDTFFVIIISGIRRGGKSTLLNQIRTEASYYVNFDDERFIDFTVKDFQLLYELLVELFGQKNTFYFDEIQNIKGWERFVRRLHDNNKKVYVTGSNARMLSKEMGTHLTGRNIPFELYPFSFKEFLNFKGHKASKDLTSIEKSKVKKLFNEYLEMGGFPEYLQTEKEEYLNNVYENILYRDIITRYDLKKEKPLKETVYFVASNIGKEVSYNQLRKMTGLSSATTIKEYFNYLEDSFLVFTIPRFSPSLKKQTYYNKKAYFIDPAMAKIVGFRVGEDKGRILENLVFLSLKRKDKEIFFHKDKHECDFLVREKGKIEEAIQVTYSLKGNKKREIEGLKEAMKKYQLKKGLILTMDEEEDIDDKIEVKSVWKWLIRD